MITNNTTFLGDFDILDTFSPKELLLVSRLVAYFVKVCKHLLSKCTKYFYMWKLICIIYKFSY